MALDLSAFDAVLKDFYRPVVVELLNKKIKLRDLFQKNGDTSLSADGRDVIYPIHYGRNVGTGAAGENKTLPAAGSQTTAKVTVNYKYNYGRIQLSEQTIKASQTSKGMFKKAMELEMKGLVADLGRTINRQLWGFGTGIICRVNGSQTTSATINMKNSYGVSNSSTVGAVRLLQAGDTVVFVRNATPTSASDTDIVAASSVMTVSSFASDGSSVTFSAVTGVTLNDNDMVIMAPAALVTESAVNREVMGMLGLIDDTTYLTTLHGVSRSTVGLYKAGVIALNGALSFDVLQRSEDLADERGGEGIEKIFSHHSVRREYIKLLTAVKRFVGKDVMSPDPGTVGSAIDKDIEYNGHPWVAERMCPYGEIFMIDPTYNVRYVNCEGEWADDDGTILLRVLNKDAYEGRFRVFDNYHNDRPAGNARIDGVTATIDYTPVI